MGLPLAERTVGPLLTALVCCKNRMRVWATKVPVAPESRMAFGEERVGTTTEDDSKFCPNYVSCTDLWVHGLLLIILKARPPREVSLPA